MKLITFELARDAQHVGALIGADVVGSTQALTMLARINGEECNI